MISGARLLAAAGMAEKESGKAPDPKVAAMRVAAAVSSGKGAAAVLYAVGDEAWEVRHIVDNTALANGAMAQAKLLEHLAEAAAAQGATSLAVLPSAGESLSMDLAEAGFAAADGEPGLFRRSLS